jgi:hypothetical protein
MTARATSRHRLARFYGDLGWKGSDAEIHLVTSAADNYFGVVGPTPVDLLANDYRAIYTLCGDNPANPCRRHRGPSTIAWDAHHYRRGACPNLYAFVDDLNKGGSTSTDLRIAILDAFNEAGIAITPRQTDATPQNTNWLREAVAEYMSGSHNGRGSGNGRAVAPATAAF